MDPNRLTLHFSNSADEAPRMARRVERFLHEKNIDDSIINKILLCVDELITNIIAHAYKEVGEHAVLLESTVSENSIVIEIRDDGVPFNPTTDTRKPNIEESIEQRAIGGLGIHLVMNLMDEVEYEREGDFNVLRATKRI